MLVKRILLMLLVAMSSCDFIKIKDKRHRKQSKQPVARVYNEYLYKEDLEGITTRAVNASDSAEIVDRYVKNWVEKQLMIANAKVDPQYNKADIERRVLDYRYALIVYNFLERLVNERLDKEISDEEIQDYYQQHLHDFELKYNIVRGRFIVVPKDAPNSRNLKHLILSKDEKDLEDLKSYCYRFAKTYLLDDTVWHRFDEVINNTPLKDTPDKVKLLKRNKFIVLSDKDYNYYFDIYAYKIVDEAPPLIFVKDQIVNIILHKRKVDLATKIKEDIFQKAEQNNDYTIYAHQ